MSDVGPVYAERLSVPWRWWVISAVFLASLWPAYAIPLGAVVATLLTAVCAAVVAATLVGYGSARIAVADGVLTAGRARIPLSVLGEAHALDAEQARRLRGEQADARAFMLLRDYIPTAVYVPISDPADATPYAYLSSRDPSRLTEVLACHTRERKGA